MVNFAPNLSGNPLCIRLMTGLSYFSFSIFTM
jgi:hypothetical protein